MEKPFSADNSPFLTPYTPPGPAVPGIKPFTAVDLAPAPGGPRLNAPPQASPFLDKDPVKPFTGMAAAAPAPAPPAAPALAQLFAANPAFSSPGGFPLAAKPAPAAPSAAPITAAPEAAPPPVSAPAVPVPLAAASAPPAAAAPALPAGPAASRAPAAAKAPPAPRQGSATGAYPKSALTMTDADAAAEAPALPMTTGPSFDGRRIRSYLGVVSAEIVIPKDVLFRNPAPYGDLHRLKAAEEHLQLVKRKAFEELGAKARALGADGVVGAALQFSQIDAMVFLCAALGTAVKIE